MTQPQPNTERPAEPARTQHDESTALDDSCLHVLPCSIAFTGMAPTHDMFRPVPTGTDSPVSAAMLRGRPLLSVARRERPAVQSVATDKGKGPGCSNNSTDSDSDSDSTSAGVLLASTNEGFVVKSSFRSVQNWHHHHHLNTVLCIDESADPVATSFHNASQWIQLSQALHEPLPVPETTRQC